MGRTSHQTPSGDPAIAKLERWVLLLQALEWSGRLALQINGGRCVRFVPDPDLPLMEHAPAVAGSLNHSQRHLVNRITARLVSLPPAYAGQLFIPFEAGEPGEPRERPSDDVYPAGSARGGGGR